MTTYQLIGIWCGVVVGVLVWLTIGIFVAAEVTKRTYSSQSDKIIWTILWPFPVVFGLFQLVGNLIEKAVDKVAGKGEDND